MKTPQETRKKYQELFDRQAQAIIDDCKIQMRILAWVLEGKVVDK